MVTNTGENEQALRRILDMSRLISLAILGLHFYYYCYQTFAGLHFTSEITDRILSNVVRTGLFSYFNKTKLICLAFLIIALLGAKGRKTEGRSLKPSLISIACGLLVFFGSQGPLRIGFSQVPMS